VDDIEDEDDARWREAGIEASTLAVFQRKGFALAEARVWHDAGLHWL